MKYLNYLFYFPRFFVARLIGWTEVVIITQYLPGVLGVPPAWHKDRLIVDKLGIKTRVNGVVSLLREWARSSPSCIFAEMIEDISSKKVT